jgi:hypothetical protein
VSANLYRCPTCGRFTGDDPDGYYDVIPGGVEGHDPVESYCDERCARSKSPPSMTEAEADARGVRRRQAVRP